ncbi:MAG: transposase [Promethearchaeota archaeon]
MPLGIHANKCSTIHAYCGNRTIPVYCELFPGNKDEHPVFKETFKHFFEVDLEKPKVILADAGPYSVDILRGLFEMGIIPLINSRKSVKKQNVIRLTKNFCLNMDFIPSE